MGNSATKLPYQPSTRKVTGFAHYAGIWQIFVGDDGATLIFRHDKKGARAVDTACAQNALKRMRSLRHPYILKLLVRACGQRLRLPPPPPRSDRRPRCFTSWPPLPPRSCPLRP